MIMNNCQAAGTNFITQYYARRAICPLASWTGLRRRAATCAAGAAAAAAVEFVSAALGDNPGIAKKKTVIEISARWQTDGRTNGRTTEAQGVEGSFS